MSEPCTDPDQALINDFIAKAEAEGRNLIVPAARHLRSVVAVSVETRALCEALRHHKPGGVSRAPHGRRPPTLPSLGRGRVEVGILDLLLWAFQRELASLDFGRITALGGQPMPGFGMEFVLIEQARLGCRVDGGGYSDPHPDADIVAAALGALPEAYGGRAMAVQIAELARTGRVPDWMQDETPKLYPVATSTNRHGTYAKTADAADLGADGWPHWRRRNRKNVLIEEAVPYCPTLWSPTPAAIAAARRGYLAWWGALRELRENLRIGAPLSAFEVTDTMPPMRPWAKKGLTKS